MPDDKLTRVLVQLQQARLSLTRRALAVEQRPVSADRAQHLWDQLTLGVGLLRLSWRLRGAEALLRPQGVEADPSVRSPT